MGEIAGKVVVITGASRGLGETMALAFAQDGARLVLAARSADDLERVQKSCLAGGAASATVVQTDVTSEDEVARLVSGVIDRDGRIDVFIANAGISYFLLTDERYREVHTYDLDIVHRIFDVNVYGTWRCMKYALPVMAAGSSFIAVGSETGRVLRPGSGAYALSKTTLDGLVTLAAKENEERGVRVNALSPGGMVDTQLFGLEGMSDMLKKHAPPIPPETIVGAARYLATAPVTGMFLSGRAFDAAGPDAAVPATPPAPTPPAPRG